MKLLRITSVYPEYPKHLYSNYPGLADKSFAEQKKIFDSDSYAWADSWKAAMEPLGYEVMEVPVNVGPLQKAWAKENLPSSGKNFDLTDIAIEQIRRFSPDVLWFDDHDAELLRRIREAVTSISAVMGWTGSAIPFKNAFSLCDVVLSCSRESLAKLSQRGHRTAELHHAFDPRVIQRLDPRSEELDLIFIGQLIRAKQFHEGREKLLDALVENVPLQIFSPSRQGVQVNAVKQAAKAGLRGIAAFLKSAGLAELTGKLLEAAGKNEEWLNPPPTGVSEKLKPYVRDGIYGMSMYNTIQNSKVTLNVHADSSDSYASNMRLFEVTGVATCLLTDWKPNIAQFFKPDEEVVTYRSPEECVEKATWLLANSAKRTAIGQAGQSRTLNEHTFAKRAPQLDEIIKNLPAKRH